MTTHCAHLINVCATAAGAWTQPASSTGQKIDLIFWSMVGLCGLIVLFIAALIIGYVVKYRARAETLRSADTQSALVAELTWIGIPFLIVLAIFVWAATVYARSAAAPLDARTVYVVGKQWMWKCEHPQGRREINELHIPAGEPIRLVMTSQDVIHSFYVPAFRVKQDVLPGRYTQMWFQATQPGRYCLFCAEYCGDDHALMHGWVTVMPPAEFQEWLSEEQEPTGMARGLPGSAEDGIAAQRKGPFFRFGCNACHWPGSTVMAPSLVGLFGSEVELSNGESKLVDEEYIRRSLMDPNADIVKGFKAPSPMPTFRNQLSERDIRHLIEFIKDLRDGWPQEVAP
jgi:cytochrome c oxidase subunit 2